ncbi:MAG: hypothetical protein ACRENA_02645 [Vulcanimicrobiaceae bacterium]
MKRLFAAAAVLLFACTAAGASAQPRAGTLLVVPFGDVSAHSGKMPSPTAYLISQLGASHVNVLQSEPIDPIVAVTEAGDLCTQRAASGVVVGVLDLTQQSKIELPIGVAGVFFGNASTGTQNAVGVTTGLVGVSGVLKRTAIQARLKLYVIDCSGKMRWSSTTSASKLHEGNNVGAGFTQVVHRAIDEAVEKLTQANVQ